MAEPGVGDEERRYVRDVQDHALCVYGAGRRLPPAAPEHPQRQPDARDQGTERGVPPAERGAEEDLGLGGDPVRPHADRDDLRHELRAHARAPLALGYPFALGLMLAMCVSLYLLFKRRNWI